MDSHLVLTNTYAAHALGLNGQGVVIGIVDTGVDRNSPALADSLLGNLIYVDRNSNDMTVDDKIEHGTYVAKIAVGAPIGTWPGGIAPAAKIVSSRMIPDPVTGANSTSGQSTNASMGQITQDLIRYDAKIMNNSWGGVYWSAPVVTNSYVSQFLDYVGDYGGLVVFAAGNDASTRPSDMAALPSKAAEVANMSADALERGWLTVAALDTLNPTQLASYSNACGVAMNYCLAVPGDVIATGANDTQGNTSYYVIQGTSYAAPQVSGAAALVWQAFPYFSNDMVRQALLGTAVDLGAAGVDEVFGYGLLDVGKAVRGPARFDWGDVTASFDSGSSTWGNAITGDGGLTKQGSGVLVIDAASNYRGVTRVEGGTLRVNQGLGGTSGTFIGNGAQLELRNQAGLNGSVDNRGTLALYANQTHAIAGDYTQAAGARLAIELGTRLEVSGTATLGGGELYVLGKAPGYVTTARSVFLSAQEGLDGEFGALGNAPGVFLEASIGYAASEAWLDITRLDVTGVALALGGFTTASIASATRVEEAFQQIDAQQGGQSSDSVISEDFIRTAGVIQGASTEAAAAAALRSLSGELHAAAARMTFDAIDMNRRVLSSRFATLSGAVRPMGGWSQRLGGAGQAGYAGTDFDVSGWMLGSDYRFGGHGVAGFAFSETQASSHLSASPDRSRDRQIQGQLYAGGFHGSAYALGQAGFGRYDRQMDRGLLLGQAYRGVSTEYAGDFLSGNLEGGYRFGGQASTVTPYAGVDYIHIRNDGFSEHGADGFGLRTRDAASSRSQVVAGVRAERLMRGFTLRGYAEWQQTLSASGLDISASLVGAEAWSPLMGMQPARSGGLVGFGIDAWLARNARLTFGYDQRFGPRGDARNASLAWTMAF